MEMTRIIPYFKVLLLSWLAKGKLLWHKTLSLFKTKEIIEDIPKPVYVTSEKYRSLFESITTNEEFLVSEQVWDQIQSTLPQGYIIPNPKSMVQLNSMSSDSYNNLFSKPTSTPHIFVNTAIWNRITHSLPQSYILPNPIFEVLTKPMSGKYYDNLFSKAGGSENNVFVDNKVWEPIKNNLPEGYSLPNHISEILFKAMDGNTYHPLISKETLQPLIKDEEIKDKISNSLPKNYKIPNLSFIDLRKTNNS
jgi:ribulose bisphosphate carboxylase small subunit